MIFVELPDDILPASFEWGHASSNISSTGELGGSFSEAAPDAFDRWSAQLRWEALRDPKAARLESVLCRLHGYSGRLWVWNPSRPRPAGGMQHAGALGVLGNFAKGATSIGTYGWQASKTVLRRGDFFTINHNAASPLYTKLYFVTDTANSNGSGEATVNFLPGLSMSVLNGAAVTIDRPRIIMHPLSPVIEWEYSGKDMATTLTLVECIG